MSPFSFITYIKGFFEIPTLSPVYFDLPRLLNLTKISDLLPRLFWPPPFIRHLGVIDIKFKREKSLSVLWIYLCLKKLYAKRCKNISVIFCLEDNIHFHILLLNEL